MNARTAEMRHPTVNIAVSSPPTVPKQENAGFVNADTAVPPPPLGLWPLMALAIAVTATLIWNGFLLWQVVEFVSGWFGAY